MQKLPFTKADDIVNAIADIPQIKRGMVWCTVCGHAQAVNGAGALRAGWPKHCGFTMTIDSPEERAALAQRTTPPARQQESDAATIAPKETT